MSWQPRIATPAPSKEAIIRSMNLEEAQDWCNFLLFRPTSLPEGVSLERSMLRPEAPPDNEEDGAVSSYRCEYAGDGRRLRMKQFLYDFAPPAFDHPSLWKSDRVEPFIVGNHIGWLGSNYRKEQAACVCIDRTTVEISAIEGCFTDEELRGFCCDLHPACPAVRERILKTSFAELCYQWRHETPTTREVTGYWRHHRMHSSSRQTVFRAGNSPNDLPGRGIILPRDSGYYLNSLFVFGEVENPHEVHFLYEHIDDPGRYVRVLASPSAAVGGVPYPPILDEQTCSTRILKKKGYDIYHAFLDERFGQHDVVWRKDDLHILMMIKPTPWTDIAWLEKLLDEML